MGRDAKHPIPESEPLMDKFVSSMMRRRGQVLTKLVKHKFGWVFFFFLKKREKPIDVVGLELHDRHKIVKQLMDLGSGNPSLKEKYACHHLISLQMFG